MKQFSPKLIIFLTIFIDLVGFGMLIPIIPFYAERLAMDSAAKGQLLGLLMGGYSLFQFLCAPLWGRLSDRIGRRPVLITSLCGIAGAYLLGALATSFSFLLFTRVLAGAFAANIATAQAYIADITSQEERAKGMGLVGAAFGLGFALGPAIGGTLVRFGFTPPFLLMAGLSSLAAALAYFLLPESHPREARSRVLSAKLLNFEKLAMAWNHPPVALLVFLFFLTTFAFSNLEVSLGYFSQLRLGANEVTFSYVFAYVGILGALVQGGLIGVFVRRWRELATLYLGLATLSLGLFLVIRVQSMGGLLLILVPVAFGVGLANPTLLGMISRLIPAADQGAIAGLAQSASSLARILGPLVGGRLYDAVGHETPFLFAGATVLVALLLAARLWPRRDAILSNLSVRPVVLNRHEE